MAQHDYVIANGTGAAVRSDLNNALAAIVSQNSGATAPATTYAFQFWADTTTGLLKLRNSANSAWVTLFQLDGEWSTLPVENGTAAAPSIYFKDSGTDTGFYSPGTDQIGISTAGTSRLTIDANGNLAVDTNTLYVDAPNNRVGIGTSTVDQLLHLKASAPKFKIEGTGTSDEVGIHFAANANNWFIRSDNSTGQNTFSIKSGTPASSTHRLLIDSSGNVGIGTTSPSAPLHINGTANNTAITLSVGGTVTGYIGPAGFIGGSDSNLGYRVESGNSHVFHTGATERARIDSSGRLLVGTSTQYSGISSQLLNTASAGASTFAGLAVTTYSASSGANAGSIITLDKSNSNTLGTNTAVANNDQLGIIAFRGADGGSSFRDAAYIQCFVDGAVSGGGVGDMPGRLVFSTTADGASSPTERMRITNAGKVLLGDSISAEGDFVLVARGNNDVLYVDCQRNDTGGTGAIFKRTANNGDFIRWQRGTTTIGNIFANASSVSYNTTSDYRLKENVVDLDGAVDRLKQIPVHRFNFIADPENTVDGFIAHEVQAVVPEAITGEKDAIHDDGSIKPQGIDQSKLVPLLTAALQEAVAKIESLEARLTAAGI